MLKSKAIYYLKIQLENEKQLVKDNPEIKENAEDNIKVLEEMIFELENLQVNHNKLEYFYIVLVSWVLGVMVGLIII